MDLTAFFSIFFILYGAYKQDTERSRILSRDPNEENGDSELYYKDKEKILRKEKERFLSFFWSIGLIIFPSLIMRFAEYRTFLLQVLSGDLVGEDSASASTASPPFGGSSSSPPPSSGVKE